MPNGAPVNKKESSCCGSGGCGHGHSMGFLILKILMAVLLVYLIVYVGSLSRNAFKQFFYIGKAERPQNTISINGEGKVTATPTIAVTEVGLITEKADVATAQKENTQKMNALIAAVKQLGIKDEDIKTTQYYISPKYDYTNGKNNINGYTVNQVVTLKIRDLTKIDQVLAKAGEMGINQVNSLNFTIDEPSALQAEARNKALADAKAKAFSLARSLGVRLVRVVSFNEYPASGPNPTYDYKYGASIGMGGAAPSAQTGNLDVVSDVTVVYEVE